MTQQIINLGSLADGSDGDTNRTAWGKVNSNFDELYAGLDPSFLAGLRVVWNSTSGFTVEKGAAYVPGSSKIVYLASDAVFSSLSLGASAFTYVYLYESSGVGTVEYSTTPPDAAYYGQARTKTGDTTRRYLFAIATDGSGNILNFSQQGDYIFYCGSPIYLVSNGSAAVNTAVSCAALVPPTARVVKIAVQNNSASVKMRIGDEYTAPPTSYSLTVNEGASDTFDFLLDSSQTFWYSFASAASGAFINLRGYILER